MALTVEIIFMPDIYASTNSTTRKSTHYRLEIYIIYCFLLIVIDSIIFIINLIIIIIVIHLIIIVIHYFYRERL